MPRRSKIHYNIVEATAARAIYQGTHDRPTIQLTFQDTEGQVVEFELQIDVAHKMLSEAMNAYDAAVPRRRFW